MFGVGSGQFHAGLYGLQVNTVPIPSTLLMLCTGFIAVVALKRRSTN
jgi:hypothetical protein